VVKDRRPGSLRSKPGPMRSPDARKARVSRLPPVPLPSSPAVSAAMRGNRSRNTRPELAVRTLLFSLGYRYRVHAPHLPGRPDICFPSRRKAIFVHGCFWHQHMSKRCALRTRPKINPRYWNAKLRRNRERDEEICVAMKRLGWDTLIVWECETRHVEGLRRRVTRFLGSSRLANRK
jgi:DNA mismatch endonuclease (patch repair protein)